MKCLQIAANREYLQELCDRKDQKYNEALAEFTKGLLYPSSPITINPADLPLHLVNDEFQRIKAESKEILQRSRDTVAAAPDDVKDEYTALESARMEWEKEAKEAKEQGLPPPDDAHIDQRRVEELEAELEQQQAELEMNLGTNPGVVEQYEKRKRDVSGLGFFSMILRVDWLTYCLVLCYRSRCSRGLSKRGGRRRLRLRKISRMLG